MDTLDAQMKGAFDAMFNLGVDRHEQGKIEEALRLFQLLSFLAPRDQGVWLALARCHDDLGQPAEASFLRSIGQQIAELAETSS